MEIKELIVDNYQKGLSAAEVGKKLGISMWSVYKTLEKEGVDRRASSETNRINFLAKPLSFTVPMNLTGFQNKIWQAGLMLYLGEGSKRSSDTVDLANCDPEIVLVFLKMLREIYKVDEKRIRVLIYCHGNKNQKELISYWSNLISVPTTQFTKPYIKTGFNGAESDKMKHGLIHIRYSDSRLWKQVMNDMNLMVKVLLGYSSGQRGLTVS